MKNYKRMYRASIRKRMYYSVLSFFILSPTKRTEFFRKKHIFGNIGEKCTIQIRKIPLYSNLIYLHNNVKISDVDFVTHDVIHKMLNDKNSNGERTYIERVDCIEIMDNVFIGTGTTILYGVRIGSNVVIGSNSLVNKDVPDNSVYAGVPAKYICSFEEYTNKLKIHTEQFRKQFGIKNIGGLVSDKLASEIYADFCKRRDKTLDGKKESEL